MTVADDADRDASGIDPWASVIGQPRAVEAMRRAATSPVHAFLLVGPKGSGKRALARAFAAAVLGDGQDDVARHVDLAMRDIHPDLTVVERVGASISADQADEIIVRANRTPVEGHRKVLVLDEFHLVADRVGPKLLKTIEEPPEGTYFVILAEEIPPGLVTVASRCVRVDLDALSDTAITQLLVEEGVATDVAERAALASGGDLHRARVLVTDERLELRRRAWSEVPGRLDGSGAAAVVAVDELLATIEDAMAPLVTRQETELAKLDERVSKTGERGSGRKEMGERHKREQRRYRADELRFGLMTLSRSYREKLVSSSRPGGATEAIGLIAATSASLKRNPNERLQLVALFVALGELDA